MVQAATSDVAHVSLDQESQGTSPWVAVWIALAKSTPIRLPRSPLRWRYTQT